jgi:hypothetical protein
MLKVNYKTIVVFLSIFGSFAPLHSSIGVESYPYGFLLLLKKFSVRYLLVILFTIIFFVLLALAHVTVNINFLVSYIIGLINIMLFAFSRFDFQKIEKLIKLAVLLNLIVIIGQNFALLNFAQPVMQQVFPRWSGETGAGYRGGQGLFSEPSRAGFNLILLHLLGGFQYKNLKPYWSIFMLAFVNIFLVRSVIVILLTFGYIIITMFKLRMRNLMIGTTIILSVIFIFINYPEVLGDKFVRLSNNVVNSSYMEVFVLFSDLSGGRVPAIVNSILVAVSDPFGGGFDKTIFNKDYLTIYNSSALTSENRLPLSPLLQGLVISGFSCLLLFGWFIYSGHRLRLRQKVFLTLLALVYLPSGSAIFGLCLNRYKERGKLQ